MKRYSLYLFIIILIATGLASCEKEDFLEYQISPEGTMPVDFNFRLPDNAGTRSVDGAKTGFVDGDVIHIIGHFTDGAGGSTDSYGCMRMEQGKFKAVDGSSLVWPDQAVEGTFSAYFISGSTGILTPGAQTETVNLSTLTNDTDPLQAISLQPVRWGHSVDMQFTHACTHLQLVNLDVGIADRMRLSKGGLNNAFFLLREGNSLKLQFVAVPDQNNGQVFVGAPMENINVGGELQAQASYFLEPGDYTEFLLHTQNDELYLSFNNPVAAYLKANIPYVLDIKKSQGIVINDSKEESWDDDGEYLDVEVDKFMKAAVEGDDYYNEEGTHILEKTSEGSRLLHNVDFRFYSQYDSFNFEPTMPSGMVFDGGHHFIRNLGYPLFRYNYGTIQNVGLNTIKAEVVSRELNESIGEGMDMSRQGGICCFNQSGATIQNVRVKDVALVVKVDSYDSQESHNFGCLAGSNGGNMIDLSLAGNFTLTIDNHSGTTNMSATIYAGGLVGQNVGNISSVSELGGEDGTLRSIKVVNNCTGRIGAFFIGGAVGINSATIDQVVLPNVIVDSRNSQGVVCYTGGLAGRLSSASTTNVAVMQSCTVSGTVYGGNSFKVTDNAVSYTGGITGAVNNVSVYDCRSVCDVLGVESDIQADVIYGTGGAFGRIQSTEQEIENITAWGNVLTGPAQYIGDFAGIIPSGQSFEVNYQPFNMLIRTLRGNMVGAGL